jgi:small redox-active disulfide protein 2
MGLFGKKKENKTETTGCSCGCNSSAPAVDEESKVNDAATDRQPGKASIKVLGSGCKNCQALLGNTKEAVADMNLPANVEYITDMKEVAKYGVMSMPALVVNEQVVSMGKVLKPKDIQKLLTKIGIA